MKSADAPYQLKMAGIALAGIVGVILVACFVLTRPGPPPKAWANGIYANPCCANIVIEDGLVTVGACRIPYTLSNSKFGIETDLPRWLGTRKGQVTCTGEKGMTLFFDGMSQLNPPSASRPPKYFQLYDDDTQEERIFTRL